VPQHLGVAITASLIACTASIPASAGERQPISTIVFGVASTSPIELGTNGQVVTVTTEEIVVSTALDGAHPLQNMSGRCGGSVETKDGISQGRGFCIYTNPQGGKWTMTFYLGPDRDGDSGAFEISGVEGNAAGWKGRGKWGQTVQFGRDRFVQRWTGWIEKP
jgi:hypothetical protein